MLPLRVLAVAPLLLAQASPTLRFDSPKGWVRQETTSRMRLAEFGLPKADGDAEDASLVMSFFGGQGGSPEANLERWIGQMAQPDGRPSKDVAKTSKLVVGELALTVLKSLRVE